MAHLLGGGQAPSFLAVAGLGVPLLVAAFLLAGRRRGPLAVGSALVLGQALAHQTLMLMSMPVEYGPGSTGEAMAHSMQGTDGSMAGAMVLQSSAPTVGMVAWHAVATVAIAAGRAFGEQAVCHLVRGRCRPVRLQPTSPSLWSSHQFRPLTIQWPYAGQGRTYSRTKRRRSAAAWASTTPSQAVGCFGARGSRGATAPSFPDARGGLVSTVGTAS